MTANSPERPEGRSLIDVGAALARLKRATSLLLRKPPSANVYQAAQRPLAVIRGALS